MGRGKVEIKKIENASSRQVTFSKRRGGLLKKAHELAVLCDAEVGLILFSSTGKLFEYVSSGSMRDIISRYRETPADRVAQTVTNTDLLGRELVKLREQLEQSKLSLRHLLGEDLSALTVSELLKLEQQLELGASRVRARRSCLQNQLIVEEVECLRRKEQELLVVNEKLRHQLGDVRGIADGANHSTAGSALDDMAGRNSQQQKDQAHPHPNLRDAPRLQTSLSLGSASYFLCSNNSQAEQQFSFQSQGVSAVRRDHPSFLSQTRLHASTAGAKAEQFTLLADR